MPQSINMVDAVFDVSGELLTSDYSAALWQALLTHLPALSSNHYIGVIPLRTVASAAGLLLPKRAKLTLRLPSELAEQHTALSDKTLRLGATTLQLGKGKLRTIQPYPTLHAHWVSGDADEVQFLSDVSAQLAELGIAGKLLCGLRTQRDGHYGYSLVIHDLKPDASLRLQYNGLGADRQHGCGIFVPYKAITDLE